jgi:hypothetical protein
MCLLNCQGLLGLRYNKLDTDEMKLLFKEHEILLFIEKWLNDLYNYEVVVFLNFDVNRKSKKVAKRDSGGVIVYISEKSIVLEDCIIRLQLDGKLFNLNYDVFLFLCYNVPTGSSREFILEQSIFDIISDDMFHFENVHDGKCHFLIATDFNARVGEKPDYVENEVFN